MDSGEVTAIASIICMALAGLGITVDPALVSGSIAGVISIVGLGAAIWSWYSHRQKNATIKAAGIRR